MSSAWRAGRQATLDFVSAQQATRLEDEYAAFYLAEFPQVVRTSYLIVHDRQGAEDVAQEAFIQLLAHWAKVSKYERPEAWVRRVAIRIAARSARREQRRPTVEHGSVSTPDFAPQDLDLLMAIKRLPARQRAAVALFYFEDLPLSEVADILGCSHATAKVHVFKARSRLAELLGLEVPNADRG